MTEAEQSERAVWANVDACVIAHLVALEEFIAEHPHLGVGHGHYRYGVPFCEFARFGRRRSVRRALDRLTAAGTVTCTGDRWRITG